MKYLAILAAAASVFTAASTASATTVRVTLTGNSEKINDFSDVFDLGADVVGSPANITGQAFVETFDLDTDGGNVADSPTLVSYDSIFGGGPPYALAGSLTINGHTFSTLGSDYSSLSTSPTDYQGGSNDAVPGGPRLNNEFSFDINAPGGAGLPASVTEPFSTAIDGTAIVAYDSFIDETSGGFYTDAIGTLDPTELSVALVSPAPEPAGWLLLSLGVGGAGLMLRRNRTAIRVGQALAG